jgi:predicted transcriptional regulator
MACLNPDGTLTAIARAVLDAVEAGIAGEVALAQAANIPLWRLRASLREIGAVGLIEAAGEGHMLTDKGREVLALSRELDGDTA